MSKHKQGSFKTYDRVVSDRVTRILSEVALRKAGQRPDGFIPTGIAKWDENGGIDRSILTLVGAGTGAGKSMLKLQLVTSAAKAGLKVLVLEFEDPEAKTADRTLANITGIDSQKLAIGEIDDMALLRLRAAEEEVKGWGGNIEYHSESLTAPEVRSILSQSDHSMVVVDYIQGVPEEPGKTLERTIADLGWFLNKHAQKHNAAVIVMSQLKAEVEQRGEDRYEWSVRKGHKPDLSGYRPGPGASSLAWSSALSQRGKALVYLWRPGQWGVKHGVQGAKDDRAEIIFSKSNFGREGSFLVRLDPKTARISDWDGE